MLLMAVDMLGLWQYIELDTIGRSDRDSIWAWSQEPYLMIPLLNSFGVKTLIMVAEYADWDNEEQFPIHSFVVYGTITDGWFLRNPGGYFKPLFDKESINKFK